MSKAGRGTLFEQFLQIKARLEQEGLFDAVRKKPVLPMPRNIGVVTSLDAAAWHDTMTALRRRVPHVAVTLAPASVQGANAPAELISALEALYAQIRAGQPLDVILLVRGGGAIEDLWAFNDELLARTIAQSPVPVISGVGHETDFTIADFVADLRAPTPTAAAELAGAPTDALLALLSDMDQRINTETSRLLDRAAQRLDRMAAQISRPSVLMARQAMHLTRYEPRVAHAAERYLQARNQKLDWHIQALPRLVSSAFQKAKSQSRQLDSRLKALNPQQVLKRGFAWLTQVDGGTVVSVSQTYPEQALTATLVDGTVDLRVAPTRPN
jgi:exodeoxyribonuclease VII large subunit